MRSFSPNVLRLVAGASFLYAALAIGSAAHSAYAVQVRHPLAQGNGPLKQQSGAIVMHKITAYAIFWLPDGTHFEADGAGATDQNYENHIIQFLQDLNGSDYLHILTQYRDAKGPISDNLQIGAGVVDSNPYPHAGTVSDPLVDRDIQGEVKAVIKAEHWKNRPAQSLFFVFTANGIQSCDGDLSDPTTGCTFSSGKNGYCGYHSSFNLKKKLVVYANQPDILNDTCDVDDPTTADNSPNQDVAADIQINNVAHELFEAATDPVGDLTGYVASGDQEIADLCDQSFGSRDDNGGNLVMNGREYYVQAEYSNQDQGCVLSLGGALLQPSP